MTASTTVWADRHPGTQHFERMFGTGHLAEGEHKTVSTQCAALAEWMVDHLPDGPELTAGLRNLWEAKNNFVAHAALFSGHDTPPNVGS